MTAQRRTERLRDVPLTISAQSGLELARQGVDDMKELAIAVPGLSFTSQGVVANPSIRGVSTQLSGPGAESPIAIYVDGVYQPNQAGNIFELPDISRVEVLKGPQGTLFGRNATGGAISIYTREPTFKPSVDITLTAGLYTGGSARSSSDYKASAYVSMPIIDDVLAASISGYYNRVDGYFTNDVNGRRTGGIKNRMVRAKILFTPAPGIKFVLSGFYGKNEDESSSLFPLDGVTVGSEYPGAIVPTQPWHVAGEQANGGNYYKSNHKALSLRSEFEIGELGDLTSITSYARVLPKFAVDIDASYSPNCLAVPFACITPFIVIQGPDKTVQQEFSFSTKRFGAFSAVVGAYYYRNNANYGYNISPPISPTVNWEDSPPGLLTVASNVRTTAYALFGEVNFVASERLKFIGGLRYSWEKKTGDGAFLGGPFARFDAQKAHALTPRLSVLYTVNDAVNVYATYSKGFKSGILDGASLTNTGSDPEKLTSYEAGVKVGSGGFKLNAAGFYYQYKKLQTQFFNGVAPIYGNAADAKLYGFDVDSTIPLSSEFSLRAAAAWTPYAKYKNFPSGVAFQFPIGPFGLQQVEVNPTGDRMLKNPKLTASATLNYSTELSGSKLDMSGTIYHSSSYRWELIGRVNTPNYTIFNAQVAFTPRNSDFRIALWGKNLSNKAYFTGTVLSAGADAVVYAPPREIGISVNYSF